jgi:hypothetical protein
MLIVPLLLLAASSCPGAEDSSKAGDTSAEAVANEWAPDAKDVKEYRHVGGSPKGDRKLAAYSFEVRGASYETLWNYYASRCGINERYAEKRILVSPGSGPNGSFVVADLAVKDGTGHAVTVFMLKNEKYTVTVTLHPGADDASIIGSISAAVP